VKIIDTSQWTEPIVIDKEKKKNNNNEPQSYMKYLMDPLHGARTYTHTHTHTHTGVMRGMCAKLEDVWHDLTIASSRNALRTHTHIDLKRFGVRPLLWLYEVMKSVCVPEFVRNASLVPLVMCVGGFNNSSDWFFQQFLYYLKRHLQPVKEKDDDYTYEREYKSVINNNNNNNNNNSAIDNKSVDSTEFRRLIEFLIQDLLTQLRGPYKPHTHTPSASIERVLSFIVMMLLQHDDQHCLPMLVCVCVILYICVCVCVRVMCVCVCVYICVCV